MERIPEVGCLELNHQGADMFLAQPRRKQARKHVRDARDFPLPFARQGAEGNSRHSDRKISLFPYWSA